MLEETKLFSFRQGAEADWVHQNFEILTIVLVEIAEFPSFAKYLNLIVFLIFFFYVNQSVTLGNKYWGLQRCGKKKK